MRAQKAAEMHTDEKRETKENTQEEQASRHQLLPRLAAIKEKLTRGLSKALAVSKPATASASTSQSSSPVKPRMSRLGNERSELTDLLKEAIAELEHISKSLCRENTEKVREDAQEREKREKYSAFDRRSYLGTAVEAAFTRLWSPA